MPEFSALRSGRGPQLARELASLGLLTLGLTACLARTPPTITRVLAGERTQGAFVSPYAYEHYLRAEMAAARGDHAGAAREFATARLGAEDDPFLVAREAESLEASGDHARADRVLAEGRRLDADSEALWLAEGRILEARRNLPAAASAFERAVEAAPRSSRGPLALSDLRLEQGAQQSALAPLVAYLARAPERGADALKVRLRVALMRGALGEALAAADTLGPRTLSDQERRLLTRLALRARRPASAARFAGLLHGPEDSALAIRALMAAGRRERALSRLRGRRPAEASGEARRWASFVLALESPERAVAELEDARIAIPALGPALVEAQLRVGRVDAALDSLTPLLSGQASADTRRLLEDGLRRAGLQALAAELASRAQLTQHQ
ncbi:MAG: hypothetical protein GXP55_23750 [Deltaproteobacteria bacterium]|nr:hypothetical protein [Deltaproteobacteria bacterium]